MFLTFNSPYLGFFLASANAVEGCQSCHHLSIPLTWDFSLHREVEPDDVLKQLSFNSPYLGFFLASTNTRKSFLGNAKAFNSPYLGFFLASRPEIEISFQLSITFQFPLLGIFPCIPACIHRRPVARHLPFNSPYLGFFLASNFSLSNR